MVKILFKDVENEIPVIAFSQFITIDEDKPTDILIYLTEGNSDLIRLVTNSLEETTSLFEIFFECNKINLLEICNDNPNLEVYPENDESVEDLLQDLYNDGIDHYEEEDEN